MTIPYFAPIDDILFALKTSGELATLQTLPEYEECSDDLAQAVLVEAGKVANEILAPVNFSGNEIGSKLIDDKVVTPQGWQDAYEAFQSGGWMGLGFDIEHGGQGMPNVLSTATNEIWHSANMAFSLCPLLTQGAIDAVIVHASADIQDKFLEKLITGQWSGTMNLTESQAGSDLALVRTSATPEDGHYLIKGQKIFITYGDHDLTENIAHLVLARLPDAPEGVKGISLFIVPKYCLNEQGDVDKPNDLKCIKLEHKLGIHGSPTCVMSFGDNGGAIGYLVGEENAGLVCMFTMMNNARHGVGLQGLSISERSFQQALAYARERVQGNPAGSDVAHAKIIEHPDVKRMLMLMKSNNEAMRGLCYWHAASMDFAEKSGDETTRKENHRLLEFLTPIVKGWCTELSNEITSYGVQVHGGMGYIEETGAAQHYRDARITAIYEGTTAIQANDLLGRKLLRDKGSVARGIIDEAMAFTHSLENSADDQAMAELKTNLATALTQLSQATDWLLEHGAKQPAMAAGASVNYLSLCGLVLSGYKLVQQASQAHNLLNRDAEPENKEFLQSKINTARFYGAHMLPRAQAYAQMVQAGSNSLLAANL